MGLLSALQLKVSPKLEATLRERAEEQAQVTALLNEASAGIRNGVATAKILTDPSRKAKLVAELEIAEKQRLAAGKLIDPQARITSLKQVKLRAEAANNAALAANLEPSTAARALRDKVAADLFEAKKNYVPLAADAEKLEELVKSKDEKAKAAAVARKAVVDKQLAALQARIKQADADLKALDGGATDDATFKAILARQKTGANAAKSVDKVGNDETGEHQAIQRKETSSASTLVDGQSKTTEKKTVEGLTRDGVQSKTDKTTTTVAGNLQKTSQQTQTTTLGLDGLTVAGSDKRSTEKDGKTFGVERKDSANVSLNGATTSKTVTTTHADGSSSEQKKTSSVERADGKLTTSTTTSKKTEDASGNRTANTTTTKGGLIAGKDGIGGMAEKETTVEKTDKDGRRRGLVAGLAGNVVCNIVPDESVTPTMYFIVLKIELGGKLGGSAGHDKAPAEGKPDEDARATASGSVSLSGKLTMERKYRMTAEQTDAYTAALKTGNGTDAEFQIIRCGLNDGWAKARDLYLGMTGKATTVKEAAKLREGESVKVGDEKKGGFSAKGGVKAGEFGVGVESGAERTQTSGTTVTKNADGTLTYDTQRGQARGTSVGANVKAGAAEGGLTLGWTKSSADGLKIVIDPNDKDAEKMQKELAACADAAALQAFAVRYPKTVKEKSHTDGTGETQAVTAGVGPVKAKVGYGNALEKTTTTDADGKPIGKTTTGSSDSGAEVSAFGLKVAGATKQQVTATSDKDGNTTADMSKADSSTNIAKMLAGKVPFTGDKEKGALSKLTGDSSDAEDKTIGGVKLSHADLTNLGALACENWAGWVHACGTGDDMKDWVSAGRRVQKADVKQRAAAVGEQLAWFVGTNSRERLDIIKSALGRRAGHVGAGAGYEFPGDLVKRKADYEKFVVGDIDAALVDAAKKKDAAAAAKPAADSDAKLEALSSAVSRTDGFASPAVRAEMLAAIAARRGEIAALLRQAAGQAAGAESLDDKKRRYNQLLQNCINFQADEQKIFRQVEDNLKGGGHVAIENTKLVNELKTLYVIWNKDYEAMARLAEENKFGSGNWWSFRPDMERYKLAYDNKAPGQDSKVTKESTPALTPKAPSAEDEEATRKARQKEMDDSIKKAKDIQARIPGIQAKVQGLGNKLDGLLDKRSLPPAVALYNQADRLVFDAKALCETCRRDHVPDLLSKGASAVDKYTKAIALLEKALAMYPK